MAKSSEVAIAIVLWALVVASLLLGIDRQREKECQDGRAYFKALGHGDYSPWPCEGPH